MQLLLKLLRPKTVPSPRRKKIPFGIRVRLSLYRSCLKKRRKWYSRYAFADTIVISGSPQVKLYHEFRDISFEAELKRLRIQVPESMLDRGSESSSLPAKWGRRPFFGEFKFRDTYRLEVGGQRISIEHGDGRSFVSTIKGRLKESDVDNLHCQYVFSGSLREDKGSASRKRGDISSSIAGGAPSGDTAEKKPAGRPVPGSGPAPRRKEGSLFGDDPLLGKGTGKPSPPETPVSEPVPTIKSVAGVDIDESF